MSCIELANFHRIDTIGIHFSMVALFGRRFSFQSHLKLFPTPRIRQLVAYYKNTAQSQEAGRRL